MRTDDLIERLAAETRAVPHGAIERRFVRNLSLGGLAALAVVFVALGLRPDLVHATAGPSFWIKGVYSALVGVAGLTLARRVARPGRTGGLAPWLALSFATFALAGFAAVELSAAPPAQRLEMWLGHSWRECPVRILAVSAPLLVAGLLAMRRFAPTRPVTAGLAVGLTAGGLGATLYGLHCRESTAAFLATWYVLGMAGVGLIGAALGSRLLKW